MPPMPKCYSPELNTLIKAMLNYNPDKRPSVNRILRDAYIKKNIAIFLQGTVKRSFYCSMIIDYPVLSISKSIEARVIMKIDNKGCT